jgi:catechol 2,3-dioxygenase-like lactoylglutathione lyase family enzyme
MRQQTKVVSIFRIFDYKKAIEFYVNWLGFKVDWEHKFDDTSPIYIQASKGEIIFTSFRTPR